MATSSVSLSELPWLWQWRQFKEKAEKIIRTGKTEDDDIQILLDECYIFKQFKPNELRDKIINCIMSKTEIVDNPQEKNNQPEIF